MVFWQKWRSASPVRRGMITREQYWILRLLSERGGMKIKELASAIGCTPGSASVTVKRLERTGLVKRERGEKDERIVTVTLAKKGNAKLESWRANQRASMSKLFDPLSAEEKLALGGFLRKALVAGGDLPVAVGSQEKRT